METAAAASERFTNRKQAHSWLKAQGYKISQGKFYQDCAAGYPPLHTDGSVSRFQVLQYGQQLDLATRSAAVSQDDSSERRKALAEAEIAEMKAERMRREEDSSWVHAEYVWSVVAALMGTTRDTLRHHFHQNASRLVHVAAGDMSRDHEVFEACEEILDGAYNEVAAKPLDFKFEE